MKRNDRSLLLQELKDLHRSRRKAILARLLEFQAVPESEYFYELAYCILTPQTSAEHAAQVIDTLREASFHTVAFDPEPILRTPATYIRFHQTKSRHLLKLKEDFSTIVDALRRGDEPHVVREWLVKHVLGVGYKEATHFLRNVGRSGGLAILDRHILRSLKRYSAIRVIPSTLSRKKYLAVERSFIRFSRRIGISLDELDLLFWSMETGAIRK
jgi:N-glycosylase/DNA lyase